MREERLPKWKILSHFQNYDEAFNKIANIIFEMHGEYWQLSADGEKVMDVMNMPSYIVEDWLWANRHPIEERVADWHIERTIADIAFQERSRSLPKEAEAAKKKLAVLQSIKRNAKIDRIL